MSMALNPDRATLNFLNAFPEEIRLRGEKLQKDGAVTQFSAIIYIFRAAWKTHTACTA